MAIIILSFLIISLNGTFVHGVEWDLEWKVNVGDSQTYTFNNCFDDLDSDGDGDKSTQTITVTDEEGDSVNVTIKKGSTMKVEITELNEPPGEGVYSGATIKITYNGKVTTPAQADAYAFCYDWLGTSFVRKTGNKSYWEEQCSRYPEDRNCSFDGDLIVFSAEQLEYPFTGERRWKYECQLNWTTGWLFSVSCKRTNGTVTLMEYELIQSIDIPSTTTTELPKTTTTTTTTGLPTTTTTTTTEPPTTIPDVISGFELFPIFILLVAWIFMRRRKSCH